MPGVKTSDWSSSRLRTRPNLRAWSSTTSTRPPSYVTIWRSRSRATRRSSSRASSRPAILTTKKESPMKRLALLWFITTIALPLSALPAACIYAQEAPAKTYAQKLVEDTLANHPEVATLAIHATPPNSKENVIIASNFGRIGKKADADDLSVIKTGRPKMEVNKAGDQFSVDLPLLDVGKNTIGALAVTFPYKAGDDKTKFQKQAELIRDHLRRRISHTSNLFDPARFDDKTPENTYAQKLVDESMARHPDVIILVMHVTPPNSAENVILGSNIGRIGKKADEDDMRVIETGKT